MNHNVRISVIMENKNDFILIMIDLVTVISDIIMIMIMNMNVTVKSRDLEDQSLDAPGKTTGKKNCNASRLFHDFKFIYNLGASSLAFSPPLNESLDVLWSHQLIFPACLLRVGLLSLFYFPRLPPSDTGSSNPRVTNGKLDTFRSVILVFHPRFGE